MTTLKGEPQDMPPPGGAYEGERDPEVLLELCDPPIQMKKAAEL